VAYPDPEGRSSGTVQSIAAYPFALPDVWIRTGQWVLNIRNGYIHTHTHTHTYIYIYIQTHIYI